MMYGLFIDRKLVGVSDVVKPLIEELDSMAKSGGFECATIKQVAVIEMPMNKLAVVRDE